MFYFVLKDPVQKPGQGSQPRDPLALKQLRDRAHPGMVEFGDQHWVSPHGIYPRRSLDLGA